VRSGAAVSTADARSDTETGGPDRNERGTTAPSAVVGIVHDQREHRRYCTINRENFGGVNTISVLLMGRNPSVVDGAVRDGAGTNRKRRKLGQTHPSPPDGQRKIPVWIRLRTALQDHRRGNAASVRQRTRTTQGPRTTHARRNNRTRIPGYGGTYPTVRVRDRTPTAVTVFKDPDSNQ